MTNGRLGGMFVEAMESRGLDHRGRIVETGETLEAGMAAVRQILEGGRPCDAIVCGEDLTAAGVLKALLRAGVRVPEQVALLCVQLLERRIEQSELFSSVTVQPELCVGQTS